MAIGGGMGGRGGGPRGGEGGPPEGAAGPPEGGGGLLGQDSPPERYTVCVRYNAKNSEGRYAGSRDGMALFDGGRFDHMVDQFNARVINQCADADYKSFPELETLKR